MKRQPTPGERAALLAAQNLKWTCSDCFHRQTGFIDRRPKEYGYFELTCKQCGEKTEMPILKQKEKHRKKGFGL